MISYSYELEKDELRYNTLSEYDEEIKRIDEILDNFPPNYAFRCAEKSIKPLNKIISSITEEEEYNEDFINEMKRIEQEKSEKLHRM